MDQIFVTDKTFHPAPKTELSAREKFLLSALEATFDDPRKIISKLLESKDTCFRLPGLPVYGAYYSKFTDTNYHALLDYSNSKPDGQATTTALLDHFLTKLDPQEKKKVVNDALVEAANLSDYAIEKGKRTARSDTTRHIVQDVSGKFFVLAQHGGDVNQAILKTTDPYLLVRNTDIALAANKSLTKEVYQRTLDTILDQRREGAKYYGGFGNHLIPTLLIAGATPQNDLNYQIRKTNITTKDPVVLSLVMKDTKLMDQLIANGHKPHAKELFAVAFAYESPDLLKHLKGLSLDINEKGKNGKTALEDVLASTTRADGSSMTKPEKLQHNKEALELYISVGENAAPYLKAQQQMTASYTEDINRWNANSLRKTLDQYTIHSTQAPAPHP